MSKAVMATFGHVGVARPVERKSARVLIIRPRQIASHNPSLKLVLPTAGPVFVTKRRIVSSKCASRHRHRHLKRRPKMPAGTLTGYALKMPLPRTDHTYVKSSNGHVWPCWGRSTGGTQICAGTDNTTQADCLSQPKSEAGIAYGRTGVCHQTANRILYPSGQTVSRAKGYRGSVFFWGTYGLGAFPWRELQNCLSKHSHP